MWFHFGISGAENANWNITFVEKLMGCGFIIIRLLLLMVSSEWQSDIWNVQVTIFYLKKHTHTHTHKFIYRNYHNWSEFQISGRCVINLCECTCYHCILIFDCWTLANKKKSIPFRSFFLLTCSQTFLDWIFCKIKATSLRRVQLIQTNQCQCTMFCFKEWFSIRKSVDE